MKFSWDCPRQDWTQIATRCPAATFFHLPAWADLYELSGQGRCETLHAVWPDGRQAVVPVGLRTAWGGMLTLAEVGFGGGYGGIISDGPLSDSERQAVLQLLQRRYRQLTIISNPFEGGTPPPAGDWQDREPTRVMVAAPLEEMRQRYHKDRRRLVRRYQTAGVSISSRWRVMAADMDLFYRLYCLEVSAWKDQGRPLHWVRSETWFKHLLNCAGDKLRLLVATVDGEVAGAELWAVHGQVATELLVARDRRYTEHQVATALAEACFAEAHDLGCRYIDSMASGALTGVDRFKASFGAEAWPVWAYQRRSWVDRGFTRLQGIAHNLRLAKMHWAAEAT